MVNRVVRLIRSTHHRVIAHRCRAEASSMPEGPATGRVGAKRRALTTSSTASASSARWWCSSIRAPTVVMFCRRTRLAREPILAEDIDTFRCRIWQCGWTRRLRSSPARTGHADSDTGDGQRWRERPRQGALGSGAGHGCGVVHAIVPAVTSARTSSGESAQSAASLSGARQRTPRQAVGCGSRSSPAKGEREPGAGVERGGPT